MSKYVFAFRGSKRGGRCFVGSYTVSISIHTCTHTTSVRVRVCVQAVTFTISLHSNAPPPLSLCFWSDTWFWVQVKPKWETQSGEEVGWLVFHFLLTHCVISCCYFVRDETEASYYCFDTSDKSKYWIFQHFCIRRACNKHELVFSADVIIHFNWSIITDEAFLLTALIPFFFFCIICHVIYTCLLCYVFWMVHYRQLH